MAALFPIMIEVEEIAVGSVLRKLHGMEGVAKVRLNLDGEKPRLGGQGGARDGAGRPAREPGKGSVEQRIVALLLKEGAPLHVTAIAEALSLKTTQVHGALHQLKKKGVTHNGIGPGLHRLTEKAQRELQSALGEATPAEPLKLPKPNGKANGHAAPGIKHGPSGRASPGSGPTLLLTALANGPASRADLRKQLGDSGMSAKSIEGVIFRAKRDKIVKVNAAKLIELTAKGTEAVAHG
jgi:hypothetical protein